MADPFIGQIQMVGFNFAPRGWAMCDGQLLPIAQYTAVFSLLGTTFRGDGRTTFGLPDLRGRSARHVGNGPGLNPVQWGQNGGSNNHTLTVAQLPVHGHPLLPNGTDQTSNQNEPNGTVLAADNKYYAGNANQTTAPAATGNTGGSQPFSIDNPYLGIYHVIALQGIYPSRS